MCDDLQAEIGTLAGKGVACTPPHTERWGTVARIELPGGGAIGLYQPSHPVAIGLKH